MATTEHRYRHGWIPLIGEPVEIVDGDLAGVTGRVTSPPRDVGRGSAVRHDHVRVETDESLKRYPNIPLQHLRPLADPTKKQGVPLSKRGVTAAGGFEEAKHPRDTKGRFRKLEAIMADLTKAAKGAEGGFSSPTSREVSKAQTAIANGDRTKARAALDEVARTNPSDAVQGLVAEAKDRLKPLKVGKGVSEPGSRGPITTHAVTHPDHGDIGSVSKVPGRRGIVDYVAKTNGPEPDKAFRTRGQAAHHLAEQADHRAINDNVGGVPGEAAPGQAASPDQPLPDLPNFNRVKVEGRPDGAGTEADPIAVGDDLDRAVQLLAEGKHVRLEQQHQVSTLLDKLAAHVEDIKARGDKAPEINLCQISVPGTNLFCAEHKGIERTKMPQLSGHPEPGSPAEAYVGSKGEADITEPFIRALQARGISITEKRVPAAHLKASQMELDGPKVVGIAGAMEAGKVPEAPIFVTRDGYIIDGHHRWAANVVRDLRDGQIGNEADNIQMPVRELNMDIGAALDFTNAFALDMGIRPKGLGAKAEGVGGDVPHTPGGGIQHTGAPGVHMPIPGESAHPESAQALRDSGFKVGDRVQHNMRSRDHTGKVSQTLQPHVHEIAGVGRNNTAVLRHPETGSTYNASIDDLIKAPPPDATALPGEGGATPSSEIGKHQHALPEGILPLVHDHPGSTAGHDHGGGPYGPAEAVPPSAPSAPRTISPSKHQHALPGDIAPLVHSHDDGAFEPGHGHGADDVFGPAEPIGGATPAGRDLTGQHVYTPRGAGQVQSSYTDPQTGQTTHNVKVHGRTTSHADSEVTPFGGGQGNTPAVAPSDPNADRPVYPSTPTQPMLSTHDRPTLRETLPNGYKLSANKGQSTVTVRDQNGTYLDSYRRDLLTDAEISQRAHETYGGENPAPGVTPGGTPRAVQEPNRAMPDSGMGGPVGDILNRQAANRPMAASNDPGEIDDLSADGTSNALDMGYDANTPEGESANAVHEAITGTDGTPQQKIEAGIEEANRLEMDNPAGREGALTVLRNVMHMDGQAAEDAVPEGGKSAPESRYPDDVSAKAGMQDGLDEINRGQDGEWEATSNNSAQGYADGGNATVTRNPDGTYTAEITAVNDEGTEIASATHTYPADTSWPDAISQAHGAITPLWEEADSYGHTGRGGGDLPDDPRGGLDPEPSAFKGVAQDVITDIADDIEGSLEAERDDPSMQGTPFEEDYDSALSALQNGTPLDEHQAAVVSDSLDNLIAEADEPRKSQLQQAKDAINSGALGAVPVDPAVSQARYQNRPGVRRGRGSMGDNLDGDTPVNDPKRWQEASGITLGELRGWQEMNQEGDGGGDPGEPDPALDNYIQQLEQAAQSGNVEQMRELNSNAPSWMSINGYSDDNPEDWGGWRDEVHQALHGPYGGGESGGGGTPTAPTTPNEPTPATGLEAKYGLLGPNGSPTGSMVGPVPSQSDLTGEQPVAFRDAHGVIQVGRVQGVHPMSQNRYIIEGADGEQYHVKPENIRRITEGDLAKDMPDLGEGPVNVPSAEAPSEPDLGGDLTPGQDAGSTGPMTNAEKIANAETMYGTNSPQHQEAQRRFGDVTSPSGRSAKMQRAFQAASEGDHAWLASHGVDAKPGDRLDVSDSQNVITAHKPDGTRVHHSINGNGQGHQVGYVHEPNDMRTVHDPAGSSGVPSDVGGEAGVQALRDRVTQANGGRSAKMERAFRAARDGDHTWLASHGFNAQPGSPIHVNNATNEIAIGNPPGGSAEHTIHKVNGNGIASSSDTALSSRLDTMGFQKVHPVTTPEEARAAVGGERRPPGATNVGAEANRVGGQTIPTDPNKVDWKHSTMEEEYAGHPSGETLHMYDATINGNRVSIDEPHVGDGWRYNIETPDGRYLSGDDDGRFGNVQGTGMYRSKEEAQQAALDRLHKESGPTAHTHAPWTGYGTGPVTHTHRHDDPRHTHTDQRLGPSGPKA